MRSALLSPKSLFTTGIALILAFALTLFMGVSNGSAGPESPNEPAVNPYAHVESSLQHAAHNHGGHSPDRDTATRNTAGR